MLIDNESNDIKDVAKEEKPSVKKAIGCLWITVVLGFSLIAAAILFLYEGWVSNVPDLSDLKNPISKYASRVYSDDEVLLGTWSYANVNRVMVPYDSLADNLVKALVAVEDERFYEHSGIDYIALGRAVVKTLFAGDKSAGGGSTITQQLAKQLYTDVAHDMLKRMMQKPIEWYIAIQLEKYYTKEEIVEMYLNYFDFLYNAVGIKNAAKTYFDKEPIDLSLTECATLVGMVKNPSYFNPVRFNERCRERRNMVLKKMNESGFITVQEMKDAQSTPLDISKFHVTSHTEGQVPYFREHLRVMMMAERPKKSDYAEWQRQQYFDDSLAWETDPLYGWCNKNTKRDGSHYNIYTDGLKIYTTIDTRMQKMAEDAMFKHVAQYLQPAFDRAIKGRKNGPYMTLSSDDVEKLIKREMRRSERYNTLKSSGYTDEQIEKDFNTKYPMTIFSYEKGDIETEMTPRDSILYYKSFLRSAMMAMDPHTGYVRAYVPGLNFKHFQYDNCLGGGRRQVGSTMKPFLYSLAMMNGYTPCSMAPNTQQRFGSWAPRGGVGSGSMSLKSALAASNNQVSAWLINQLRPENLINLLHQLGVGTIDIEPYLPLCLGTCDISVGEMCSAYTVFANKGVRIAPTLVSRIEDADGNVVATFIPRPNEVMSENQAYQMVEMMRAVICGGTGGSLRGRYGVRTDTAGKTGTTNSHADAWFMGVTPNLVVATWVGGDDRDIHFNSMDFGQGARAALPIYAYFMKSVYSQGDTFGITESDVFERPKGYEECPDEFKGLKSAEELEEEMPEEDVDFSPSSIDESFQ